MSFIQITDTHFIPKGQLLYGLDPYKRLQAGIDLINKEHNDADFVLVTGDLADLGDKEAYIQLQEVVAPLTIPIHFMMGNHDSRAPFREIFTNVAEIEGGFFQYAVETDTMRIVCLDSLIDIPGVHQGQLCETRLRWLDAEIAATPSDKKLVIANHHPPFDLGIAEMDKIKLTDSDAFQEVLEKRKPDLLIFGHIHLPISGNWRGIPFHIQRGFNHQGALNFVDDTPCIFIDENPDIAIIRHTQDSIHVFTKSVSV